MRLFIAVNFPPQLRSHIYDAIAPLREQAADFRWLLPDTYHLTLKFLGYTDPALLEPIRTAMEEAARAVKPFQLTVTGFGGFPTLRRPRVAWLGLAGAHELSLLQQEVERTVAPLGFSTEARPFHPHITVGRLAAGARSPDLRGMERLIAHGAYQQVMVETIELMESKLLPKGARYEVVASARLRRVRP